MLAPFLEPSAEEDRHGLRDPPFPRDPIPHRAGRHAQPGSSAHLGQAKPFQGRAQLLRAHWHRAMKIGTTCPCLASRHIVPTFPAWLLVSSRVLRHTSALRSSCSASSMPMCVGWGSSGTKVTRWFACSWRHDASSGLPWPRLNPSLTHCASRPERSGSWWSLGLSAA